MSEDTTIHLACCSKCGNEHPFTREYFAVRKGAKLHPFCRSCARTMVKTWRQANPGRVQASRDKTHLYHSDAARRWSREWGRRNRLYGRANRLNQLARNVYHVQGIITKEDISAVYDRQAGLCIYCRRELNGKYDVDHIMPMSRGGLNTPENIVVCCHSCNASKGNRTLHEWIESRGGEYRIARCLEDVVDMRAARTDCEHVWERSVCDTAPRCAKCGGTR